MSTPAKSIFDNRHNNEIIPRERGKWLSLTPVTKDNRELFGIFVSVIATPAMGMASCLSLECLHTAVLERKLYVTHVKITL